MTSRCGEYALAIIQMTFWVERFQSFLSSVFYRRCLRAFSSGRKKKDESTSSPKS